LDRSPRLDFVQCITPFGLHRMAYNEYGDPDNSRVLVCVHGLSRAKEDFTDLAHAMLDHYRVVCPDVPGRGDSDWLPDPSLYQYPIYVADMVTLLARVNAKTVHWFGTSMGGLIGMLLAAQKGTPIERMVLNDVGPVVTGLSLDRIASYVGKTMTFPSYAEATDYVRCASTSFGAHTDVQWRQFVDVVIKKTAGGFALHYDPAIARALHLPEGKHHDDVDLWQVYDAITCPVLAVRGEQSDLLRAETHQEMARRGPRAELATIPKVGHAPTFMSAGQIDIAREFLLRGA
jgi:pimeloyl-ACP methyl ester carboxylesterase